MSEKSAQRLTVTESPQAIAKILDVGLFGLVHEHVTWVRLRGIVAHLRDETRFRHIEMASTLVHFFAGLVGGERRPLGDDIEVRGNLQERVKHQGLRFRNGLFHRQDTDDVIAYPQMIAFGFDVGVGYLIVEKLRGLRLCRQHASRHSSVSRRKKLNCPC